MRAIFMGTPDFSVPVLTAMIESGHTVAAVVTQPDRPKGRGKEVQITPVKAKALEYNIPILQPTKVREKEFVKQLQEYQPEVIVVAAFGQILSREVLEIPKMGCINVHASLLPMYRGAAPIQQVILDGQKETGVTTMMMEEGLDTGDMLLKTIIPLAPKETGGSLHDKLSQAGAELLIRTLEEMEAGTLRRIPQEGPTCYAGVLRKSMGEIDWNKGADEIERLIRGLNPWPSAYTHYQGKMIKIWEAECLPDTGIGQPGQVILAEKDRIGVKTGEGILLIRALQPEGKKRMDTAAYLRGYPLEPGEIFG